MVRHKAFVRDTVAVIKKISYLTLLSLALGQRDSRREAKQLRGRMREKKVGIRLGRARRCCHAGQGQINPDQVTPQRGSAGSSV